MAQPVVDAARRYLEAGLSIIPILADGTKAPAASGWADVGWWERLRGASELERLFGGEVGIGVLGGQASGGLEILDFDRPGAFESWALEISQILPNLLHRLPRVRTPNGGRHVYYRCSVVRGAQKLAMARTPWVDKLGAEHLVISETRGVGGYVVAPPSPPQCHAAGRLFPECRYEASPGPDITEVPTITEDERAWMLSVARSFDERPIIVEPPSVLVAGPGRVASEPPGSDLGLRPGDDYNRRTSWADVLEPHGWTVAGRRGETALRWRRPGKAGPGWSATTGACGDADLLYVFSTSAAPFESQRGYSKFAAYAALEHAGDFHEAARGLGARGYGEQTQRRPSDDPPATRGVAPIEGAIGVPKQRFFKTYREAVAEWSKNDRPQVIPTGIAGLDEAIGGGLRVGQVTVILGYSGTGKSEIIRQIRNRAPLAYHVDVEEGLDRLITKDVSEISSVPSKIVKDPGHLSHDQQMAVMAAAAVVADKPGFLWTIPGGLPLDELEAALRSEVAPGSLLVIDSAQRLAAGSGQTEARLRLQEVMFRCCALAQDLGIALLLTSEQRRSAEGKRPSAQDALTSGAESRSIEYQAFSVLALVPEGQEDAEVDNGTDDRLIEILVSKTREGRRGYISDVLKFSGPCWQMTVIDRDERSRQAILDQLELAEVGISASAIAKSIRRRKTTVLGILGDLEKVGRVTRSGTGKATKWEPGSG